MRNEQVIERAEVSGRAILGVVRGFRNFTVIASQYLQAEGLGELQPDGNVLVDAERWYPVPPWLRVLERVEREFGQRVMKQIGEAILKHSPLPPGAHDIPSALEAQNAGFHLAYRLDGRPMWDVERKAPVDGIGDYAVRFVEQQNLAFVTTDSISPCGLAEGTLTGLIHRLDSQASISHEPGECRSKGGATCTWRVTWPAG